MATGDATRSAPPDMLRRACEALPLHPAATIYECANFAAAEVAKERERIERELYVYVARPMSPTVLRIIRGEAGAGRTAGEPPK